MLSMRRNREDLIRLFHLECCPNMQIKYSTLEHTSCNPMSCIRWNHLLFCGSQEPQRGFRNLWLDWGCALGRMYQRPQRLSAEWWIR